MLRNMRIGKRLIVTFILVTIIASAAGILGVYLFARTDNDYSYALENYGFASGKVGMLSSEIQANRAAIRDIVFLQEQSQKDAANQNIQDSIQKIDVLLNEIRATNTSDAAKELFAQIETEIAAYRTSRDQVIQLGMANDQIKAYDLLIRTAGPQIDKISADIEALYQLNYEAGAKVSKQLSNFGSLMLTVMVIFIVTGYVIAIAFAVFISRGISKPITMIQQSAKKMAEGDYELTIDYQSHDEIGSLADSMRQMMSTTKGIIMDTSRGLNEIANGNFDIAPRVEYIGVFGGIKTAMIKIISDLSETMDQIKISADQVSTGSDQVSSGSQALAQGATEQASSVQELSASINEVSQQIRDNAANAATASQLVDHVGENISTSSKQMGEMMSAMSEISSSSSQIGKIIKTIEDIAFQTNILALNAAVEAARAGAAGKGFAVVADEVRNLATKSSEAAKQTNVLIEGSVKSVENGVKIADATAKSLTGVVSGAKEVTLLINKITHASTEQSNSIAQINLGIEQISSVVQTNSATSEESAAASEELNGQANMMKAMINQFKLKPGESRALDSYDISAPVEQIPYHAGSSARSTDKY